jgi:hypothetical protein
MGKNSSKIIRGRLRKVLLLLASSILFISVQQKEVKAQSAELEIIDSSVGPVSVLRALFEFVLPMFIAVYAVAVLLRH